MYTPVFNSNLPLATNTNTSTTPPLASVHVELAKILRKNDSNATRLYDFVNHVRVFHYNATEAHWEDSSCMEGNLFVYERKQNANSKQTYVFAVINKQQKLIQDISAIMSEEANQLFLFYEIVINNKCEVFSLHFSNENECSRLHIFINQVRRKDQAGAALTSEPKVPTSSTPVTNSNDQTLSLKRLLNIPSENKPAASQQEGPVTLMPPSSFITSPSFDQRTYLRDLLLDLVQTNDDFVNIIRRACHTYSL